MCEQGNTDENGRDEEEKKMETTLNQKYAHLKDKLHFISKEAELLKGKDGMVELNPDNPHHREWYEQDDKKEP